MSLRIAPPSSHPTSVTNLSASSSLDPTTKGAPSAPGIHDTLRSSLSSTTATQTAPASSHPLEARLAAWQSTQDEFKMTALRRNFGIGEPVRRGMELKIVREGEWTPMALGGSAGVSGDILTGRDTEVTWEDVFKGDDTRESADFHAEMERKLKMDW
ncbi:MAG: hypothetical protein LQ343_006673 [Gyalolechia ehrenbergii]|nr:MAG: hypothetical protein LQ343_006673 [Gyalolechia ehrenbergii]